MSKNEENPEPMETNDNSVRKYIILAKKYEKL